MDGKGENYLIVLKFHEFILQNYLEVNFNSLSEMVAAKYLTVPTSQTFDEDRSVREMSHFVQAPPQTHIPQTLQFITILISSKFP